jgi:hypothetical protein
VQELEQHRHQAADGGHDFLREHLKLSADTLLSSSAELPTFGEFLRLCGLDKSALVMSANKEVED